MKKRIAKKRASQFLQGKYPCSIRREITHPYNGVTYYEHWAILPTPVALWVEELGHAGTNAWYGCYDTPLFLGTVDFNGDWVPGLNGWGDQWERIVRSYEGGVKYAPQSR